MIQIAVLAVLLTAEPVVIEEGKYQYERLFGVHHSLPNIVTSATSTGSATLSFGDIKSDSSIINPISTDFGIVIEKINANAKVIADVDPASEGSYMKALSEGVAHAKGTVFPGQKGNIYLFSHSVDAPWNVVRYNAVFYLLRELENGDRIILFYQGRRFDYYVFDKTITDSTDVHFLTDNYDQSVLTLQTCDPPGTIFKRLVVRAKLAGV